MSRTRFVPEAQPFERRYGRDDEDQEATPDLPSGMDWEDPEYASVADLAEYLMDCEREEFTAEEMQAVASRTRTRYQLVKAELESLGFRLARKTVDRQVRTFGDNPHNRWTTPEARMMSGGGGGSSLIGMAR